MHKRILGAVTVFVFTFTIVLPSYADISLQINNMFNNFGFRTSSTAPNVYMAQSQGMIAGGAFSMRAPQATPVWLANIQPPRFKAGCGGVDMFFGGLSFPNAQEFTQMLKAIGQNAIGYAFKLALRAISPSIATELGGIEKMIRDLNKLSTDSCQAAKQIVGPVAGVLGEKTINACAEWKKSVDDMPATKAYWECADVDVAQDFLNSRGSKSDTDGKPKPPDFSCGVSTWAGMDPLSGLDEDEKILILNLVGAFARKGPADPAQWFEPRISFRDFIDGTNPSEVSVRKPLLNVLRDEKGCLYAFEDPNLNLISVGFKTKVLQQLQAMTPKIMSGTSLNEQERAFINSMPTPLFSLIKGTRKMPALTDSALDLTADFMAFSMANASITRYINAAGLASARQNVVLASEQRDVIKNAKDELHKAQMKEMDIIAATMKTYELAAFFIGQVNQGANSKIPVAFKSGAIK